MANRIQIDTTPNPFTAPLEASRDAGATFTPLTTTTVGTAKRGFLETVPAATYAVGSVQVRAVGFPTSTVSNAAALTVLAATVATAPGAVTALRSVPNSTNTFLSWDDAPANGSPITDYLIESRLVGGTFAAIAHPANIGFTFMVTGLTAGASYDFRVSGVNAVGTGPATILAAARLDAAQPVNLVFVGDSMTANGLNISMRNRLGPLGNWLNNQATVPPQGFESTATGGANSADILAQTNSTAVYIRAGYRNICSVWAGRNDNTQEVASATFYTTLKNIHAALHTQGYQTVAATVTPSRFDQLDVSGVLNMAQHEAKRITDNQWIRDNWNVPTAQGGLGAILLADPGGDAIIGQYDSPLNAALYVNAPNDRTHFEAVGGERATQIFAKAFAPVGIAVAPTLQLNAIAPHNNLTLWTYEGPWIETVNAAAYTSGGAHFLDANAAAVGTAKIRIATSRIRIWVNNGIYSDQVWESDGVPFTMLSETTIAPDKGTLISPNLGPGPHLITTRRNGVSGGYVMVDQVQAFN